MLEVERLRKDLESHEIVINGYQRENERLMSAMKKMQADAVENKRLLARENEKIVRQMSNSINGNATSGITYLYDLFGKCFEGEFGKGFCN
jgi:hypothetical protein